MPFAQTHCSSPRCQQMHTQVVAVESCWSWEVLHWCSHTEGASHKQFSARHSPPLTHLIFLLPECFPCSHLGRGMRSLLPPGNPAQATTSQQHRLSQTPGHSSTWKRGKWDRKTSLPQHTRLIPRLAGIQGELLCLAPESCCCSHGYMWCRQ